MNPSFVEITAMLDQPGAKRHHRSVLLAAVAARDHDSHGNARPLPGIGKRLAMVATGRRDYSTHLGATSAQPVEEGQPATDLERPGRRMVLMLDPDLTAGAGGQEWPGIACGRRKSRVNDLSGFFELGQGEHCGLQT